MRIVQKSKEKMKSFQIQFKEHEKVLEDQHNELLKRLSDQQVSYKKVLISYRLHLLPVSLVDQKLCIFSFNTRM